MTSMICCRIHREPSSYHSLLNSGTGYGIGKCEWDSRSDAVSIDSS